MDYLEERQRLRGRVFIAIDELISKDLQSRFLKARRWDSNWFDRWVRRIDFVSTIQEVAQRPQPDLRSWLAPRLSRQTARVVDEGLSLIEEMLMDYDGEAYRDVDALVRFALTAT